ncbi:N-methyl-L-tryptophan oxidase [Scopulibacillus cellulosilyticus]|uniref:N-methyl-L-tryptophan oxidase n=1 Tax=Scopulibacillus cellulosilyticus TaxID=2665665 RepID=A0ABW2Q123_9BACL
MDADVGVIGVGTMGSMAMWQLAERGVSVIGFEQFGTGHDRSAVGGGSRIFRTAYLEGSEYVPLLKDARRFWQQLEAETGNRLLTLNGGLMIGHPESKPIRNVMESIETYDLDYEVLKGKEAAVRYPQHRLLPEEVMVLDKQAGFLRPEKAVVSAVQLAEALGAKIHRYTKVKEILPDNEGVTIKTKDNDYRVGKVLLTAGPWAGKLFPNLKNKLSVRRLIMTWFAAKDITLFEEKHFPVFARMTQGEKITGAPAIDGSMVRISNNTALAEIKNPDDLNRNIPIEDLAPVSQAVQNFFPDLIPYPVRANAFMDTFTPDQHPIVGKAPGVKNVVIQCGFSGHGFKMAPVMGKIASDLILEGDTEHNIKHLDPSRYL